MDYKIGQKIKICACGCEEFITFTENHKVNGIPKFILGHNSKIKSKRSREETRGKKLQCNREWYRKNKKEILERQKEDICIDCGKNCKGKRCWPCNLKYKSPHKYKIGEKIGKCKCGCEEWIIYKRHQNYKGIPEYKPGHSPSWSAGLNKFTHTGIKKISESKIGEQNPMWNGGSSFEPYDKNFNEIFKKTIRKRDNKSCMICEISEEQLDISLAIHHINYDKKLSIPQNCISLCNNCHMRTNWNRKQWIVFFQSLLSERYGYNYSSGNILLEVRDIQEVLK